ncbi:hypothetical protein [Andreprevotia sp. IGB-42]|uniref:hypothetical protein n=1 Tax=Andreprevotia sp. IGB-42 TaxID=2497473 RepID=UPI00135682FE|nr:hypothetical protein [Andreprevotia sp. IGB-42]
MAVKPADPQLAQAAAAKTEALAPTGVEDCTDLGRGLARDNASVTNAAMGRRPVYSQHIPCRKDPGTPQESSDSSAHPLAPGHRMI